MPYIFNIKVGFSGSFKLLLLFIVLMCCVTLYNVSRHVSKLFTGGVYNHVGEDVGRSRSCFLCEERNSIQHEFKIQTRFADEVQKKIQSTVPTVYGLASY